MKTSARLPYWGACYGGRVHFITTKVSRYAFTACGHQVVNPHRNVKAPTPGDLSNSLCPECVAVARRMGAQVPGLINFKGSGRFEY